jgi:hypothetical protein|tara:strand:+ start:160 stop:456 length:297 start_codon:yes stop_codon:yes gene_type:complete
VSETETLLEIDMSSSLDRLFEEAREDGSLRLWEIGDMVVVHTLNDLVGEITKRSLNGDGEYDYMVDYEDGACEWCEASDLREANDLDNWSLTCRGSMF